MSSNPTRLKEGVFDLAIVPGPGVAHWPTIGAREISAFCSKMGLKAGIFGGSGLLPKGVVRGPDTGGVLISEDVQNRLHRVECRSIVRFSAAREFPDPFPGWRTPGLLLLSTAERLLEEGRVRWEPTTVILGTGNEALRFGSRLIEEGRCPEVICIETREFEGKGVSGWEVEKRRFERMGGKIAHARPIELLQKSALRWEVRVQDKLGVRRIEVAWLVSAGPFSRETEVEEYPLGSLLFDVQQTAAKRQEGNPEGWNLEIARCRWVSSRIVKALRSELGDDRDETQRLQKSSRLEMKRAELHEAEFHSFSYQGKLVDSRTRRLIQDFEGVPRDWKKKPVASIECFEPIECRICEDVCPEEAINIVRNRKGTESFLKEDRCTACGVCVEACPSQAIVMLQETEQRGRSNLTFPWRGRQPWNVGELATLVNRRGEGLASARVARVEPMSAESTGSGSSQKVEVEVPHHLLWDARGLRRDRATLDRDDEMVMSDYRSIESGEEWVEIQIDGAARLVRKSLPLAIALYEIGYARPRDVLLCKDASCRLCSVVVDGVKKLACVERVHSGMHVRLGKSRENSDKAVGIDQYLCPCLEVGMEDVRARIRAGELNSPEAVISATRVGEGRCHGQMCMGAFERLLRSEGVSMDGWLDWRFPWSDWVIRPSRRLLTPS